MPHEIPWSLTLKTAGGSAVTLDEAKDHLKITWADEDTVVDMLAKAATEAVQEELSRALTEATWELRLDRFPVWEIRVPRPPLKSVTSIKYLDNDGVLTTLATSEYTVETFQDARQTVPARIVPAHLKSWPTTQDVPNAVVVEYVAGVTSSALPASVRLAILMTAGELYLNRERSAEAVLRELAMYERLIANYRVNHEFRYRGAWGGG